jgi:hypothetical protein
MPDYIPRKKKDLFDWSSNVVMPYMRTNHGNWNTPSLDPLETKFLTYKNAYLVADNPETRTPAAVHLSISAQTDFVKDLRKFIKSYITYNPLVTEEDRINMELPLHKQHRTPVPVPLSYPAFKTDLSVIRFVTIHFHNIDGKPKSRPLGSRGAEIRWAVLDSPPSSVDDLGNVSFATRTPHSLEFTEQLRNKMVYICLRWETRKGDKGPWSEIVKSVIP